MIIYLEVRDNDNLFRGYRQFHLEFIDKDNLFRGYRQ